MVLLLAAAEKPALGDGRAEAYLHFSLGLQARLTGDAETALSEYRRAQKLDPEAGTIRLEIAKLLRDAGRFEDAITEVQAALALSPDDPEGHRVLGQLYQMRAESGDEEASLRLAAAELDKAASLQPGDATSLLQSAAIYTRLRDHKEAARVWQKYLELDPSSFDAQVQLGSQYLAMGDTDRAATALQKAVELDPSSARAYQSLGEIYADADQTDQAILHFRKALELEPGNVRVHLRLGEVLFQAHRYDEALAEAKAVLKLDPKNVFAGYMEAESLREKKDFDAASRVVDGLLAQAPGDLKARFIKVTIAEGKRDFAESARLLEGMLEGGSEDDDRSNDRLLLVHLGFAYQQLGRFADAAGAFEKAAAASGGEADASLLGYRVDALILAKDYDQALAAVRDARSKFPDDPDLASAEATILHFKGDDDAALVIVDGLVKKAPADVGVLLQVAEFYQRVKRYPDAESALRKARALDPTNLRVLFQLGAAIERQKRPDEAEAVFREALKAEPDSAPVLNYLGYMNADRGVRLEEAASLIEKAVSIDPENGAYLDSLGWVEFKLNRFGRAEEVLRRAVSKPGSNAVVFDHLGDVLENRGKVQEALVYWRKALDGEDEDGELDRALVEKKIREAQSSLDARKAP
jgi:tetratricopeptide (TPR) repeat protein